jgi:type IV secretion system protein VirB5
MSSRVVPFVVEVDTLGAARAVSEAEAAQKPTDPQVAWALSRFIANIRGLSLDPVLMRRGWLEAYDFATRRGALFLSDHARSSGALSRIGERAVSVQVTSVVRASPTSFQIKWTEAAFERGSLAGTSRWTAILTTIERPPRDAETLRRNPLGIYVDAIDWSRELDVPTPATPPVTVKAEPVAPVEATAENKSKMKEFGS